MTRHESSTIIVTGAGSGIGRAIALTLAAEGARVVGMDVDAEGLEKTAREAVPHAHAVETVVGDVASQQDVDAVVRLAGRVDGLVNNAGVMDFFLPVGELDDATWARVMSINLDGPMRLTRAVVEGMRERGRGAIVNIGSIAGLGGGAAGTAYTTSKHALVGLTRSTAYLYGPSGVRCNIVCPGGVTTNIGTTATPRVAWAWDRLQPSFGRAQRQAEPHEIATLVSWLLSDEAVNVNGAVIASDGGWTAA